jgi:hypothetical protein
MKLLLGAVLGTVFVLALGGPAWADDKEATAILDKGIKALGGEEKLAKVKAVSYKGKGKLSFGGNDSDYSVQGTMEGLDKMRQDIEGEFMGNKVQFAFVLAGDKGWRKFGEQSMELDKDGVANQKRALYLQALPTTLVQLKGKDFKLAAAGEVKVGDKPAVGIKVTAPDGKDFTLYFDKESGLPVKMEAKVAGFMGGEFTQETTFGNYKEFNGIKKATKIENKRNGEKFQDLEITEFKMLDKVDPKTFDEPK